MPEYDIRALAIHLGWVESSKLATLIVNWNGEPFKDPVSAIRHFVEACKECCTPPAAPPHVCGKRRVPPRNADDCRECGAQILTSLYSAVPLDDYLYGLLIADADGFQSAAYPYENPPEEVQSGDFHIGGWRFEGIAEDCDVVAVSGLDYLESQDIKVPVVYRVYRAGPQYLAPDAFGELTSLL